MFRNFCLSLNISSVLILAILMLAISGSGLKHSQNCIKHKVFRFCCIWNWYSSLFSAGMGTKEWRYKSNGKFFCGRVFCALAKLRKALPARPNGITRLPLDAFSRNWYLIIFRKSVEKIQDSLKYDKNKGYFTWRLTHIDDNISLGSS
jgi:hypothetical protein